MSHIPDPNKSVNLTIDGIPVTVPEGTTILEAAKKVNVKIPVLCHHPDLKVRAVCRLCVVECDGARKLKAACAQDVWEGVSVVTDNARLRNIRRMILEMILAEHPQDCLSCIRNQTCELQELARQFGIYNPGFPVEARDMEKLKRSERVAAITRVLTREPGRLFTLREFVELFGCAKSTLSEDITTVRNVLQRYGMGMVESVNGAAGGVRFYPFNTEADDKAFIPGKGYHSRRKS